MCMVCVVWCEMVSKPLIARKFATYVTIWQYYVGHTSSGMLNVWKSIHRRIKLTYRWYTFVNFANLQLDLNFWQFRRYFETLLACAIDIIVILLYFSPERKCLLTRLYHR